MKAVVVLSGGQDSTTCMYWARQIFHEVFTITFDYGQRHSIEIEAAMKVSDLCLGRAPYLVDVKGTLLSTSPLLSDSELEQYKDAESLPGGIEKTFVPCRNQLFLTIAANYAYSLGARAVVTGVCQTDYGGYPDCRHKFIHLLTETLNTGTFTGEKGVLGKMNIDAPLMFLTKKESIDMAIRVGAYPALAWTHTAYDGNYPPQGKDHASLLRARGFEEAGVPDPLVCRAFHEGLMDLPDTSNYDAVRGINATNYDEFMEQLVKCLPTA